MVLECRCVRQQLTNSIQEREDVVAAVVRLCDETW